ncbi:MAG: aspartate/glutamate racemase family protein [Xanthobacteraceae bacterium]
MKKIGLIIPPADGTSPAECQLLYPQLQFVTRGLGVREMSSSGFASAEDRIVECARSLGTLEVVAISVMGTSLTFHKGRDYNDALRRRLAADLRLPVTTMSTAVVRALQANGATRVALATAYTPDLNADLSKFLALYGIHTGGVVGLGIKSIDSVRPTSARIVKEAAEQAVAQDPSVDALLISCGGLPTVQLHVPLEDTLGIPVISSLAAGLWDVVGLSGEDPRLTGFGKMFAAEPASAVPDERRV